MLPNPGNVNDGEGFTYGGVAYEYKIAKNETTIGQYAEFLNAVAKSDPYLLYNPAMTFWSVNGISQSGVSGDFSYTVNPGSANKPISNTSWFDAARFCNWLQNGQGSGSTETGAYTLNGAMSGIIIKNVGATIYIPDEDEWYKAAYYDPTKNAGTGGYWRYPTQSDTLNGNTVGNPNSANYNDGDLVGDPNGMALTDVGAYGENSESFYGTNDQGGNVEEWNDGVNGSLRNMRGGQWNSPPGGLDAHGECWYDPVTENSAFGFRVASVPEPTSLVLTVLFSAGLVIRRKR